MCGYENGTTELTKMNSACLFRRLACMLLLSCLGKEEKAMNGRTSLWVGAWRLSKGDEGRRGSKTQAQKNNEEVKMLVVNFQIFLILDTWREQL